MANEQHKEHFWIPDSEVTRVGKKPTARGKSYNKDFVVHGAKLGESLSSIKRAIESVEQDDSLADIDLMVFKIELPEGEKIKDKSQLFHATGLEIKAVKTERTAIVSTTKNRFSTLQRKIETYSRLGSGKTHYNAIDDFQPYIGSEKNSSSLQKLVASREIPPVVDIQLMLLPRLDQHQYKTVMDKIAAKVSDHHGKVKDNSFYLSDNTPVLRAVIPSIALSHFENDSAIYRIEETDFFSAGVVSTSFQDLNHLELDDSTPLDTLPIVVVLDSGVSFPKGLQALVYDHWTDSTTKGGDCEHGTKVASRVAFRYISDQLPKTKVAARARIIDCNIMDGLVAVNDLIKRIQRAVATFSDFSKIFNLSVNVTHPIEGDEMSIIGYELDVLQEKYKIQFVISAGNHELWKGEDSLFSILDDDESRVAAPADSMLSIVVGSVIGNAYPGCLSDVDEIAPYSRRGPGFNGYTKPDLTAYSGCIIKHGDHAVIGPDTYSMLLNKHGMLTPDAGTSFSTPVIAGDLAELMTIVPKNDILAAKTLLYHTARPLWDEKDNNEERLIFSHNLYGNGISDLEAGRYSSPSRVIFMRTGVLSKVIKERINLYMPEQLAQRTNRGNTKVTVTCVTMPPVDRTKGTEYLGAYVRASLHKKTPNGLPGVQPDYKEGRRKWDVCQHFSKSFTRFQPGEWQVWLELFSRWDESDEDVPYALAITIEDMLDECDVYSEIQSLNRYQAMSMVRTQAKAQTVTV